MAYFSTAEEVYDTIGQLVQDAALSLGLGPELQQTDTSVRLALSGPEATITVAFREGGGPEVTFGSSAMTPALTLEMSTDTAHEMFLGKLRFVEAASDGRVKQEGASASLSAVWPVAEFALPARYSQILVAAGRDDLA